MADLIGQIVLLAPSEGGRQHAAYSGFSPQARLPCGLSVFSLRFMCDDSLRPGESDAAMIDVDIPEKCQDVAVSQVFDLLENKRTIGQVTILENLWAQRQKKTRSVSLNSQVPCLGVSDMESSIAFYHGIGFEILHEHRDNDRRVWAQLKCGNVNMMVEADGNINQSLAHREARSSFCLYTTCDDAVALHHFLSEHGYEPSAIESTFYGMLEFAVVDPDGYKILFAQPSHQVPAG